MRYSNQLRNHGKRRGRTADSMCPGRIHGRRAFVPAVCSLHSCSRPDRRAGLIFDRKHSTNLTQRRFTVTLDPKIAIEHLRAHFANLTPEQFEENLRKLSASGDISE